MESSNTTARITMDHWVNTTLIVRHLFLTVEVWQGLLSYELSEHSGCAAGNTQSFWRYDDRVDFDLLVTAVVPRPMYRLPGEPALPSNKNFLSFFSLSF